ncbi:SDR family NAD(P)-dependent oxidoreductase [Arthrobacter castelli]|uniref:SDR family NAD(P)-dependent oxidoreductase n=1 Tax=Arthrobacter castelli TaxID=271431 RepID=UPI0003F8DA59|nr:SDR family oxidoreductase [Arthrobacter castelli]
MTDDVVVVTGGGRSQGFSHVTGLAELGYVVYSIDVAFPNSPVPRVHEVEGDITDTGFWASLRERIGEDHGNLAGLVNNAGIIHHAFVREDSVTAVRRLLDVNLTGVFNGIHAMWPLLVEAPSASIVNIASIYGTNGAPGYGAYSASKAGIIGFTKTVALEGAEYGVRANAIAPGTVLTEMRSAEPEETSAIHTTPLGRGAQPEEISAAVCYLLSDQSSFVTGSVLTVDGGYSAR